jgi:hypothetical protein
MIFGMPAMSDRTLNESGHRVGDTESGYENLAGCVNFFHAFVNILVSFSFIQRAELHITELKWYVYCFPFDELICTENFIFVEKHRDLF